MGLFNKKEETEEKPFEILTAKEALNKSIISKKDWDLRLIELDKRDFLYYMGEIHRAIEFNNRTDISFYKRSDWLIDRFKELGYTVIKSESQSNTYHIVWGDIEEFKRNNQPLKEQTISIEKLIQALKTIL